jgi:hypothetical protein
MAADLTLRPCHQYARTEEIYRVPFGGNGFKSTAPLLQEAPRALDLLLPACSSRKRQDGSGAICAQEWIGLQASSATDAGGEGEARSKAVPSSSARARTPDEIFANGLKRGTRFRGPAYRYPLSQDAAPNVEPGSMVCITRDFIVAANFPLGNPNEEAWIYALDLDRRGIVNVQSVQYEHVSAATDERAMWQCMNRNARPTEFRSARSSAPSGSNGGLDPRQP